MFDTWKLNDFAPSEGLRTGVHLPQFDESSWINVSVPGDVHSALIAAGRIEDPFYDRNETKCTWIEEREWWYRIRFLAPDVQPAPDECLRLIFHGLDTFATLWLNGEILGTSQNMFHNVVFDVTHKLKYGQENVLAICFDCPLDHVDPERLIAFSAWGRNPERVFMRKAQFGYGWDWGPRLPTIGIWRPVELRTYRKAALRGLHFKTILIDKEQDLALLAVRVEIEHFVDNTDLTAKVVLTPAKDPAANAVIDREFALNNTAATIYLELKQPDLWWTHDIGEPALHQLTVTLSQGTEQLDTRTQQVGIRTLSLDQSPDPSEPGTRFFRFVLNGIPIFARGANWIPADSFVGAIPDQRYQTLLQRAQHANMNMLRVWGGGIYEHDIFYDLCDQLGLLVWQDFMFACAMYPEDDSDFIHEVETEAVYQVERLRNHASLALWCGNNENQWIHDQTFWDQPDFLVPGALYYHNRLPQIVAEKDGQTPYWPGSPFGGSDYSSMEDGNRHNWQVWHGNQPRRFGERPVRLNTPEGVSYTHYAQDMGRFISEFGMHAAPVLETLRRCIPSDQLYHHSASMDHHNKDNPKNKGDNLMLATTGLPETLEDYVDMSMIAQAEGLKFAIEHFRQRKPHCSGSLFWQLNDCWPGLSWSVVDYYGVNKAGYYFSKRAYAPVLASFKALPDGSVELWISNDTLYSVETGVIVKQRTFDGHTIWSEPLEGVRVPANSNLRICRWDEASVQPGSDRYLSVTSTTGIFERNRHFFGMFKDLMRTPVGPTYHIERVNKYELSITLTVERFAYFVHFHTSLVGVNYSDNYLDIEPGETKHITIKSLDQPLEEDSISVHWR